MCNLPVKVVCRANAEYMSPSGKCVFSVDTVYSFVLRIESQAGLEPARSVLYHWPYF